MSLRRYYQQVGRCVRTHPDKPYALVVDMVGLVKRFGKVEDMVLRENGGKWCYTSGDRQLTNQYFGETPQEGTEPLAGCPRIKLRWSEPDSSGLRTATPDGAFWSEWRTRKEELKSAGVFVRKIGEEFVVFSSQFK